MGWSDGFSGIGDAFSDFGGSLSDSFSSFGHDVSSALGVNSTMGDDIGYGNYSGIGDSMSNANGVSNNGGNSQAVASGQANASTAVPLGLKDIQHGYAQMLRSDYDYWRQNFRPFEELYRSNLNDPVRNSALTSEALGFVDRASDNAYRRSLAQLNYQDRKYGIDLTPEERASRNRRLLLTKRANQANNRTNMRQYLNLRNRQFLNGGVR